MEKYVYANAYNVRSKYLSQSTKREIVAARTQLGLTQTDLNSLCEFVPNTIYKIETGSIVPTISQLNRLNYVLLMDLHYC